MISVGRVTAVHWPGDESVALALAEMAERATSWPGISEPSSGRVRLILAPSEAMFDSVTQGRLPEWGGGAAFPGTNTIVLPMSGDVRRVLRHELAHLALHSVVKRVPRWFDEGYAARAAGEWDRLQALRVNWALLMGVTPTLREVDAGLRGTGAGRAQTSYSLATTAVLLLERMGGDRGLEPLLENLSRTPDFDQALRTTYLVTLGQFETLWRRDLKRRYGWALLFGSLTVVWTLLAIVLVSLWATRRRRDRARRARLDEGWSVPGNDWQANS
ncbi:MAG: hypothetical protein JSW51_12760 [Gemmatimonadota bacterium]|nr:MAG: hypothetical protein JSW51_12760 [Gemmatimonadota bacterium]